MCAQRSGSDRPDEAPLPLAILAKDASLAKFLPRLLVSAGLKPTVYSSARSLLKKAPRLMPFAVVWDTRVAEPDYEGLAAIAVSPAIIVIGGLSPAVAPEGLDVMTMPEDTPVDVVSYMLKALGERFASHNRADELELYVSETEDRFSSAVMQTKALKEHMEFYEMQRNQLSEVVRRTAYLGQLSKEINCLDIDKILELCVTKVPKIVDAGRASVYIYDKEAGQLVLKRSNHPYRITDRVLLDTEPKSLMSMAMERTATLLIRDVDAFSLKVNKPVDRTHAKRYTTKSCIIVPLVNDDEVMAVLNLSEKDNGAPFDEVRDLPLVDHITQFIGIAMRNCQLYEEVWKLAKSDALTGFINHNAFFDELHREMARVCRNGGDLSLIIIDVDNFKLFNDVHGHQVGDMILTQVAEIIRTSIRTVDAAARYGGDEFAVILGGTNARRAEHVAERIRKAIAANQLHLDGNNFFVTVSAGVAQYATGQSLSDMVNEADAALYKAKSKGRNAVVLSASGK